MGGWMRMNADFSVGLRPLPSGRPARRFALVGAKVSCSATASRNAAEKRPRRY